LKCADRVEEIARRQPEDSTQPNTPPDHSHH
jgi:hypothetical protein